MSNLSGQIIAAIGTTVESAVTSIARLNYVVEVDKNDFEAQDLRYGVRSLGAESDDGPLRQLILNHDYEIILTEGYYNVDPDDIAQMATVDTLHDRMDEIAKQMENTKLGLSSIVHQSQLISMNEPEFLSDEKVTILRATFTIQYRSNL